MNRPRPTAMLRRIRGGPIKRFDFGNETTNTLGHVAVTFRTVREPGSTGTAPHYIGEIGSDGRLIARQEFVRDAKGKRFVVLKTPKVITVDDILGVGGAGPFRVTELR